ncbi:MAG: prmC [Flavipsychrobacter sp.]|nr:prmC [Flavipsychrobacter sp.]
MLTYNQAFYELKEKLQPLYDEGEAAAIAHMFMEWVTGLNKLDRLAKKDKPFSKKQQETFESKGAELMEGKPIQYVTSSAWFMDREYLVNEHVLIPRPETEELVQWILADCDERGIEKVRILDIGAGSGCISLSLFSKLEHPVVTSVDISKEALNVLQTNVEWVLTEAEKSKHPENIRVLAMDFLNEATRNKELGRYDVIVSNPPYIPKSEKKKMHANVTKYEPQIALFVPDNDALVFYKAIASFGKDHLREDGSIYCELDAAHAEKCKGLFEQEGYGSVELKKDIHGNWRMLKAGLS